MDKKGFWCIRKYQYDENVSENDMDWFTSTPRITLEEDTFVAKDRNDAKKLL